MSPWKPISSLNLTNDGQAVIFTDDGSWISMGVCRRGCLYESTANAGLVQYDLDGETLFYIDLRELMSLLPLPVEASK